jgi:hypothetical protein
MRLQAVVDRRQQTPLLGATASFSTIDAMINVVRREVLRRA